MADITIRNRNGGQLPNAMAVSDWDPIRRFRELFNIDPFEEMAPVWRAERAMAFMPTFEVKETKDAYLFKADVPAVKESDLDVSLTGSRLTISGKREAEIEDKTDTYYTCERSYGSFTRAFTLPEGADLAHLHAEMKQGVLTVVVPKLAAVQPRKVTVQVSKEGQKT